MIRRLFLALLALSICPLQARAAILDDQGLGLDDAFAPSPRAPAETRPERDAPPALSGIPDDETIDKSLLDASILELKQDLALNPRDTGLLLKLGELFTKAHRLDEAAEMYWRAARLEPGSHTSLHLFGFTLLALGDHYNGEQVYRLLYLRAGKVGKVLMNLSAACYGLGKYEEAHRFIDLYILFSPREDPRALYNMGLILLAEGQPAEALEFLERSHKALPDQPAIAAAVIRAHRDLKRPERETQKLVEDFQTRFGKDVMAPLFDVKALPAFLDR